MSTAPGFAEDGLTEFALTVDDLAVMVEAGMFERDGAKRVELVDGRLVQRSPESPPHSRAVMRLARWADSILHDASTMGLEVLPGGTVRVSDRTALDPDLMVVTLGVDATFLQPTDVKLLVEVSVTTLSRDLGSKARAYAMAGLQEYWVVDLAGRTLHVHRLPDAGRWADRRSLVSGSVEPLFAPGASLEITSLF